MKEDDINQLLQASVLTDHPPSWLIKHLVDGDGKSIVENPVRTRAQINQKRKDIQRALLRYQVARHHRSAAYSKCKYVPLPATFEYRQIVAIRSGSSVELPEFTDAHYKKQFEDPGPPAHCTPSPVRRPKQSTTTTMATPGRKKGGSRSPPRLADRADELASLVSGLGISGREVKNQKYRIIDVNDDQFDDTVELILSSDGSNPNDVYVRYG